MSVGDRDDRRTKGSGLLGQQIDGGIRGQRKNLEAIRQMLNDTQRVLSDRTCGADDGELSSCVEEPVEHRSCEKKTVQPIQYAAMPGQN